MLTHSINRCIRNFTLTCLCVTTITAYAARAKLAPVDLSILEERDALSAYMDVAENITLLQLEKALEQAESDLRSSEHLMQTKESAFKDSDDVKKRVEEGEALFERATVALRDAQVALVEFLKAADTKRAEQRALLAQKYNVSLETKPYEIALIDTADTLLKTARTKGYKTVFYDGVSVTDAQETKLVTEDVRKTVYDTLVEVDGENYTLIMPTGLKLDDTSKFTLENFEDYENNAVALLAIEVIQLVDSEDALLYTRLLDLHTFQIIDHALLRVTGADVLWNAPTPVENSATPDTAVSDTETAAPVETAATDAEATSIPFPIGASISDDGMWIDKLAQQTYRFTILTEDENLQLHTMFLSHSLLKNSTLTIIDDAYIARVYGSQDTEFSDIADAQFSLINDGESNQIKASANSSDHVIDIGSITLVYE
ncbi:MAG: hypothetical protein ACSHX8_11240 [Opitutaceae bacterium]